MCLKVMMVNNDDKLLVNDSEEAEMKELISVIVLVYNVEQYLEQCLQSVINQKYRNIEIIIVCKDSGDRCSLICEEYAQVDSRIVILHQEEGGIDVARKLGVEYASGKYIGYVDGDDWIEPEMYGKLLEYAQIYDVDVVESGAIDSGVTGEKSRRPYIEEGCYKGKDFVEKIESKILYVGVFFEHGISPYMWSKLFLRDKLLKYQMMPGIVNEIQDDTMVSLPLIAETKSVYISHDCYYHYRIRAESGKRACRKDEIRYLFEGYSEFYSRFKGTKLCSKDDKQINYFVMYWLMNKAPYAFDDPDGKKFLAQFGGIEAEKSIVLYGAGSAGIHLENYIRSLNKYNIVCWVDRNYRTLCKTMEVLSPDQIIGKEYDYVIISILRETAVKSVKQNLKRMGVPDEKILWIEQKYIDNPELLLKKVVYQGKRLI